MTNPKRSFRRHRHHHRRHHHHHHRQSLKVRFHCCRCNHQQPIPSHLTNHFLI